MILRQVKLRSGTTERVCWVEHDIKLGERITLKDSEDPTALWTVVFLGDLKNSLDIKKDWKVGGL